MIERKAQIHNSDFLISPTMHLFPLSGQSGIRGVSIKITLKYITMENEIDNESKYTILYIRAMLV